MRSWSVLTFFLFAAFSVQAQVWTAETTTGGISGRGNAGGAYDEDNHRLIVFGGRSAAGFENDLWCLDLTTKEWSQVPFNGTAVPNPRHTQSVLWDAGNERLLVWNGQGPGSALYNDVWAFNFADSTWEELSANGNVNGVPSQRYGVGAIFDPQLEQIITFAGFSNLANRADDTWTFNTNTQTWTDRTNTIFPIRRCLFNQAELIDRREMIIFGGQSNSGNRNDIWSVDLDTYVWTDLTPATSPSERHFASLVYDGDSSVILFGGNSAGQNNFSGGLGDLWSFSLDAQEWTQLTPSGGSPEARTGQVAIFLPQEDRMVLFGGRGTNGSYLDDVWTLSTSIPSGVIDPMDNVSNVSIYPNPALDNLNLLFVLTENEDVNIRVLDQTGRVVLLEQPSGLHSGSNQVSLNTEGLSAGVYTAVLETKTAQHSRRVVILPR